MQNLELKAKYKNKKALKLALDLNYQEKFSIYHFDTYFNVKYGRLKLREINNTEYELIAYSRPDGFEAKNSSYEIYTPDNPDKLKSLLTASLGIKTIVCKRRQVFIYKDCRIHIDNVRNLGEFLEFEVVMIAGRSESEAKELMQFLINHFEIDKANYVNVSYSDLTMELVNDK